MPPLEKPTKKISMLQMHKENYESNLKLCKPKLIPMQAIPEVSPLSLSWRYFCKIFPTNVDKRKFNILSPKKG
jgi:hypothetical protein